MTVETSHTARRRYASVNRTKYEMNPQDRDHIEHKFHDPEKPHDAYRRFAYHGYDYDPATGMDEETLKAGVRDLVDSMSGKSHAVIKAAAVKYLLDHTRIDVNEYDWYIGFYSWGRVIDEYTRLRWARELFGGKLKAVADEMGELHDSGVWDIWPDYDHSIPDWDSILSLGFYGLRERARDYRRRHEAGKAMTSAQMDYFDAIETDLSAILDFIHRLRLLAESKNGEKSARIAKCLARLEVGAPTDTFEALQLMYLYFMLSESVESYQVRSLGSGFDRVISPYYERDLANGTYTAAELDDFLAYFLMQFYAIGNYWGQPLFLGGRAPDGSNYYCALSLRVLELWDDLDIHNPKIQVLFNDDTPTAIKRKVYDMIRRGKYLTVVCEPGAARAVKAACGCGDEVAKRFIVSGCYEPLARGGCNLETGHPNLVKIVSLAMRDGFDPITKRQIGPHTGTEFADFEQFFAAFAAQLRHFFGRIVELTTTYEPYFAEVSPALLYSSTLKNSLERAEDGYACANPYSNSSMGVNGFGSAIDAMMAVKTLVFDRKLLTIPDFVKALDADWEGYDELHRLCVKECPKFGTANPEADVMGQRILDLFPAMAEGVRNVRGGRFITELHGAMEYVWEGERTEATPDGRFFGAETSKNASPTVGADVFGATAFIRSCTAAACPESADCGFNADMMLHPSALAGEEGLTALDALVKVYMKRGGVDIQFNVVSPDTLRDAQAHPEKYKNLQIRVSGWNVLWNDIPRVQQDSYIKRAETITGN